MNNMIASIRPLAVWKIRGITAVLVFWAIVCVLLSHDIYQTYGLLPADGGVLKPLKNRVAFSAFVTMLGLAGLVGMHWLLRRYVFGLQLIGEQIVITVAGWLAPHSLNFHISELTSISYLGYSGRSSRRAPFYRLMVADRGFVFDVNPRHLQLDQDAFSSLNEELEDARMRMGKC